MSNEEYDDLGPEDVIQEGDERCNGFRHWMTVGPFRIGKPVSRYPHFQFRRPRKAGGYWSCSNCDHLNDHVHGACHFCDKERDTEKCQPYPEMRKASGQRKDGEEQRCTRCGWLRITHDQRIGPKWMDCLDEQGKFTTSPVADSCPNCAALQTKLDAAEAELTSKSVHAEFGREWMGDSSLEKWFPFTAKELNELRQRAEDAEKLINELPYPVPFLLQQRDTLQERVKVLENLLADANRGAERNAKINQSLTKQLVEQEERVKRLEEALRHFADVNLSEDNCASFEVANKRIRNLAKSALDGGKGGEA